jgi:K+-sensing histidine kinase KdpD
MFDFPPASHGTGNYPEYKPVVKTSDPMNLPDNNILNSPTLLTGMSHEVRTHMNAIVAFSFLMKENNCNNAEREEFGNLIFSSCDKLIGLIDSFLDSAIIDTGASNTDVKNYEFDSLLNDLFFELRGLIKREANSEVELVTEVEFKNSHLVLIDKARIVRIIQSLFQNALKYTKAGYIKIGYNADSDNLNFYILDSGNTYQRNKELFQAKNISESLSANNDTYIAINLILARRLVNMLGGTIRVECNGISGSGMYFSIPAKIAKKSDSNIDNYVNSMIAF